MNGLLHRTAFVAATFLLLATRLALGAVPWDRNTFLTNVQQLASQVDLRDTKGVARFLGADLGLRPYCASPACGPGKVLGMVRAFPDPLLRLPGDGGVSVQYYAPDSMDPPGSDLPLVGTLAVLDVFPPRGGFCLHRSDVRAALGPEAFRGSPLNRGEPLDIALDYVAASTAGHRTTISFIFARPVTEDGCLALASVREDNFGLDSDTLARRETFRIYGRPETEGPYFDEEPVDLTVPRNVLDPADVRTSPLGLTLAEFAARFPQCEVGSPSATERGGILTEVPPPLIPLLPTLDGAYLATSHSIRDTASHADPLDPAIDPTLLTPRSISCALPTPAVPASQGDAPTPQNYGVLTYEGRIAVLFGSSAEHWHSYVPAGILTMEALAPAPGASMPLAEGFDALAAQARWKADREPRPVVVGFAAADELGTLVRVFGPRQTHDDPSLDWSSTDYAFIDMALWRSYSERVRETLQALRDGKPAGFAEACTPAACPFPPPEDPVPNRHPDSAIRLLRVAQALVAAGNLTDYRTFGPAAGGKALLLRNDGPIQDAVDQSANEPFTVGLAPGPTMLDGFGFQYWILPKAFGDTQPRFSPYHREVAFVSLGIGRYGLGPDACITRDAVIAVFGPNQSQYPQNGSSDIYAYKFDLTQTRGHTIYVRLHFIDPEDARRSGTSMDTHCATNLEVKQYLLVQPQ